MKEEIKISNHFNDWIVAWSVGKVKKKKIIRTKNGRIMLLSKCSVSGSKKSKFIKEQEARRLLSSLGIRTHLSQTPL